MCTFAPGIPRMAHRKHGKDVAAHTPPPKAALHVREQLLLRLFNDAVETLLRQSRLQCRVCVLAASSYPARDVEGDEIRDEA